jgi:hypothetical protein
MESTHRANVSRMSLTKTKKLPAKGIKLDKQSMHEAKLMDIEPEEKASSCDLEAINKSDLSADKLDAYMLDMSQS